jgi:2-isopropylmalate synthase
MGRKLVLKDTTFRDGVQGEGVEATDLNEALLAIQAIDRLGVAYHEVGFATADEATRERIRAACRLKLDGKVAAFGRTHPDDVKAILKLRPPVGVLVAKTRAQDAAETLQVSPDENLVYIHDSVSALRAAGLEVFLDGEHFFQAYFEDNRKYALETLRVARKAGANWIVLCDTNGKMTPALIRQAIRRVKQEIPVIRLGIHTHNDRDRAVVNAEAAWEEGVRLIEGTVGGYGERTGNCNLCAVIPNLVLDYQARGFTRQQLALIKSTYLMVCDVLNQIPQSDMPWVGEGAFYSEAGMHVSGDRRSAGSYFHADPRLVGNQARVGVSEQSGRANLLSKAEEFGIEIPEERLPDMVSTYQDLVDQGEHFGLADASCYLFLRRQLGLLPDYFQFVEFRLIDEKKAGEPARSEASLRMEVKGKKLLHNADGDGPVNALDKALRRTLRRRYPSLKEVRMHDFKVRIVDAVRGTGARVRVLIELTDGAQNWFTVATDEHIVEAARRALFDGYAYKLAINGETPRR